MIKNKILKITLLLIGFIAIFSTLGVSVWEIEISEVDKLYSDAYNATITTRDKGGQKNINTARTAIAELKKVLPDSNAIPTWSSIVDHVQHPILVKIIDGILAGKDKLKNNQPITQGEVNVLRVLCLNDLNDSTDDLPPQWYARGWSQEIDILQQSIIDRVVTLVVKAENDKTAESVAAAQAIIDDMQTAYIPSMVSWADTMEVRLSKVEAGVPLMGYVAPGSEVKLPFALVENDVAVLSFDRNCTYRNIFQLEASVPYGDVTFYHAVGKGGEISVAAHKMGGAQTLYIFNKVSGELRYKKSNYVFIDTGFNLNVVNNTIEFLNAPQEDGWFMCWLSVPHELYGVLNKNVPMEIKKSMTPAELAKAFYDGAMLHAEDIDVPFPIEEVKIEGNRLTLPAGYTFSFTGADESIKFK